MGEKLNELLKIALSNDTIKNNLILTKQNHDPYSAFCEEAKKYGLA